MGFSCPFASASPHISHLCSGWLFRNTEREAFISGIEYLLCPVGFVSFLVHFLAGLWLMALRSEPSEVWTLMVWFSFQSPCLLMLVLMVCYQAVEVASELTTSCTEHSFPAPSVQLSSLCFPIPPADPPCFQCCGGCPRAGSARAGAGWPLF